MKIQLSQDLHITCIFNCEIIFKFDFSQTLNQFDVNLPKTFSLDSIIEARFFVTNYGDDRVYLNSRNWTLEGFFDFLTPLRNIHSLSDEFDSGLLKNSLLKLVSKVGMDSLELIPLQKDLK